MKVLAAVIKMYFLYRRKSLQSLFFPTVFLDRVFHSCYLNIKNLNIYKLMNSKEEGYRHDLHNHEVILNQ